MSAQGRGRSDRHLSVANSSSRIASHAVHPMIIARLGGFAKPAACVCGRASTSGLNVVSSRYSALALAMPCSPPDSDLASAAGNFLADGPTAHCTARAAELQPTRAHFDLPYSGLHLTHSLASLSLLA